MATGGSGGQVPFEVEDLPGEFGGAAAAEGFFGGGMPPNAAGAPGFFGGAPANNFAGPMRGLSGGFMPAPPRHPLEDLRYAMDPESSGGIASVQKAMGLPPSFPWTPGPTLPTEYTAYDGVTGMPAPPLPLWIRPSAFYGIPPRVFVPHFSREQLLAGLSYMGGPTWFPQPLLVRGPTPFNPVPPYAPPPASTPPRGYDCAPPQGPRGAATPQWLYRESPSRDLSSPEPEPDHDLVDRLLAKREAKAKAERAAQNVAPIEPPPVAHGGARPKAVRVYSAGTLKSLNVAPRRNDSATAGGEPRPSEPWIDYAWPAELKPGGKDSRLGAPGSANGSKNSLGKHAEPPRPKSSMHDGNGPRKLSSPNDRGHRRRNAGDGLGRRAHHRLGASRSAVSCPGT